MEKVQRGEGVWEDVRNRGEDWEEGEKVKYREKQASKKTGDNTTQSNDESLHEMETRSRHGEVGLLSSWGVFLTIATLFFSLSVAFSLSAPASAAPPPHPPAPTLPPVPLSHSNQLRETRHRQLYPFSCCRLLFFSPPLFIARNLPLSLT